MTGSERPPLNQLDIERGLRISIWEGVWSTVYSVLTGGAFQIGFARYIGANDFALGLIAALPAAANLIQLPAALHIARQSERRRFVGFTAAYSRWLWIPILLIPFFLPAAVRIPAFLLLLTLSAALMAVSMVGWMTWMSDLVPPRIRGMYFGRRNMLAGIVAVVVPLPAAAFLDQAVKYGRFDPRIGFAVLFGIGALAGCVCLALILRQPEPPPAMAAPSLDPVHPANGLHDLLAPLTRDINFRRFLIFSGATVFGQTMAGQFFTAWQLDHGGLRLSYFTVQVLGAVAAAAGLSATPLLGLLGDRFGSRPVLILSAFGVIVPPFFWLFTVPTVNAYALNVTLIVVLNVISGATWAGMGLSQFNLILSLSPTGRIGAYSAVFSALTGIVGAVAPIVGGILMGVMAPITLSVTHGLTLNNYKLLFLFTGLMRIGFLFLLSGVRDGDSRSTRYMLGKIAGSVRRPASALRTLREGNGAADGDDGAR